MPNKQERAYIISSNALSILAISIGVLLVCVALVGGVSLVLAFARGILGHTLNGIRQQVLNMFFDFFAPLIGGIVLAFTGLRVMRLDKHISRGEVATTSRKRAVKEKEHMINVFLNNDEKKIINLVKEDQDGSLQSDLVIKTGYSKVKMHRILKSLENKGLIKRGRFGITNKVFINNQ